MNLLIICFFLLLALASVNFSEGRRIVGGNKIEIKRAPYQVSLQIKIGARVYHICGGSLISDRFVISAAHCVDGWSDKYQIRAGSSNTSEGGEVVEVDEVFAHPSYSSKTFDYDFSLLRLEESVSVSDTIKYIKLPNYGDEPKTGEMMVISGWGETHDPYIIDKYLRAVDVPIFNIDDCKRAYGSEKITDRMICAGYANGGKDSCQGDSGGAMKKKANGELIGIISWGTGCAVPGFPGVYSKVSSVRPWIQKVSGV